MGQAARAYKLGELNISCICSSFPRAFGAGGISGPCSYSMNNQDCRSVVNNHPPCLGTSRSQVYFTLWSKQLSFLPKMQSGLGHTLKDFKTRGLTVSGCVHVYVFVWVHGETVGNSGVFPQASYTLAGFCLRFYTVITCTCVWVWECACVCNVPMKARRGSRLLWGRSHTSPPCELPNVDAGNGIQVPKRSHLF